jgi:hypothetical protein
MGVPVSISSRPISATWPVLAKNTRVFLDMRCFDVDKKYYIFTSLQPPVLVAVQVSFPVIGVINMSC